MSLQLGHTEIKRTMEKQEFRDRLADLIRHYNISASAKYTLTPTEDFVYKVIREFVELTDEVAA